MPKLIEENTVDPEVFRDMDDFEMVNKPTGFANSFRIQFPKFAKHFSSSDFEDFVKEHVGIENVKSLGRLQYPNEWYMEVKNPDIREKLIRFGKMKIKNRSCWISPLCSTEIRGFVHWVPNFVSDEKILNMLAEFGEVLFLDRLKQRYFKGRVNSDSRYFALYLRAGKSKEDLPHFVKIDDFLCLTTVRGRNPVCFFCKQSGHTKVECKKYRDKLNSYCQRVPIPGRVRKKRGKRHKKRNKVEVEVQTELSFLSNASVEDNSIKPTNKECELNDNTELDVEKSSELSPISSESPIREELNGTVFENTDNTKVDVEKSSELSPILSELPIREELNGTMFENTDNTEVDVEKSSELSPISSELPIREELNITVFENTEVDVEKSSELSPISSELPLREELNGAVSETSNAVENAEESACAKQEKKKKKRKNKKKKKKKKKQNTSEEETNTEFDLDKDSKNIEIVSETNANTHVGTNTDF
ncbi:CCHC-type domain-containing protein [Caerostris darwini]|uniref:CCHC-type domain-containing protein n=1 Tax=Caerostris darwini TaxID=1538125 RepID=A0AAV4R4R3_9ARAC|nr:CCHC-type domain-containing protein [Caerostris darwini]